jgi:hypothetical protein
MKYIFFFLILSFSQLYKAQTKNLNLKNALVIGQLDRSEDRYSIEIALTELLADAGVKALPSLNILKVGADVYHLENDSIQNIVTSKGLDTYLTVSVRGYDKRFKLAENRDDFKTAVNVNHLFPLYKDEVITVSFEFTFYRNGNFVGTDIVRCGNVDSRETVLKRFKKKTAKRIKKWL